MRYFVDPPIEDAENFIYPCGTCNKRLGKRMRAIRCDLCNFWNHIKCDGIEPSHYEILKNPKNTQHHYCKRCKEEYLPFQTLDNEQYIASIIHNVNINEDLNLRINPPPRLRSLFNDLNDRNEDSQINCEYYDYSLPIPYSNGKNKALFHMNIASLNLHKDEMETALSLLDFQFDVIGITETKFQKGIAPIKDPSLTGYKHYHTPTESSKGGALLYVKDSLVFDRRDDLENLMYKSKELESVFIEVEVTGKKNKFMVVSTDTPVWILMFSMRNI